MSGALVAIAVVGLLLDAALAALLYTLIMDARRLRVQMETQMAVFVSIQKMLPTITGALTVLAAVINKVHLPSAPNVDELADKVTQRIVTSMASGRVQ